MITHEDWMIKVVDEAKAAAQDGGPPAAAIIVQGETILGMGRNTKTSQQSGFAHAELNALLAAKHKLGRKPEGAVLYSTLEPCAMCLGAIVFSGIRTLVYGAADPEGGAIDMFRHHATYRNWMPTVVGRVMESECGALKRLPTFNKGNTTTTSSVSSRSRAER